MKGYELTERGKIAIAVFLAILLIVLAVILAIRVWNSPTSPFDNQQQPSEPDLVYNPPEISNTPLPEDNGVDTTGTEDNENGEQGSFDAPQEPTGETSENSSQEEQGETPDDSSEEEPEDEPQNNQQAAGSPTLNRSAGTMSFRFSPSSQDSLDADVVAMIGDFIDSPRNTANTRIIVSIPQLPEEETSKIIAAVIDAFAEQGVPQSDLGFTVYNRSSGSDSYEIRLSFSQATSRK